MPHGKFIIEVKPPRRKDFGELTVFEYDSAAKQRTDKRYGVLERVASCVTGWQSRYAPYNHASFRVREVLAADDGKYGRRKGTFIDLTKELEKERGARAAFQAALAAERWAEQEAADRKAAKAAREAAEARGEVYVAPAKPKAPKKVRQPKAPKPEGELTRRDIRRAAKRACIAKEGSKDNWRNYL